MGREIPGGVVTLVTSAEPHQTAHVGDVNGHKKRPTGAMNFIIKK